MAATTRNLQIFVNGASVLDSIGVSALTGTVVQRPININSPIRVPAGGSNEKITHHQATCLSV